MGMSLRHAFVAQAVLITTCLATTAAWGQEVERLYEQAKVAIDAERYDEAAEKFEQGYVAATDGPMRWRMALGLALSHELDGDLATAAGFYAHFLDLSADHPEAIRDLWAERRKRAERDLDDLVTRLADSHARLRLDTVPPGASMVIDGEPVRIRQTPATFVLALGEHRVVLSLDGHLDEVLDVTLGPNERAVLQRSLRAQPPPPEPIPAPVPISAAPPRLMLEPSPAQSGPDPLRLAGLSSLGLGLASIVSAAVITGLTAGVVGELEDLREVPITVKTVARDRELRDDLDWMQPAYAVLYTLGGVAAAAGLTMVLWPSDEPATERARLELGPLGAALVGRF
jgi:PEGA domain